MLKRILPPLLLSLAIAGHAGASADPSAIASLRRELQTAVNRGDASALRSVRARFSALAQADPKDARVQYWVAVSSWRVLPFLIGTDKKLATEIANDAMARADQALAIDSKFAEALAVKAGVQGMMISLEPNSMMTLGPQSGANLARAAGLQPDNPRIHLLAGISTLHKPAQFGGGAKPSLDEFRRANALFAKEAVPDSTAPDWGRDDALLWTGRAQMELRDFAAARESFRAAVAANPDNQWVRYRLLPAAEDSLAKAKP
ncbi:MAG TPA: hypothetical protein VMJ70_12820 [Candidatus Sulfotelmatobacter sp.]|nr:hypothetical protein [Candidatus Sulfotelmatobacter sp.]